MSVRYNAFSLSFTAVLLFSPNAVMAAVGPDEPCSGAAIVWPTEDQFGSIYISSDLRDVTFPQVGYLPSGTVVNLEEPYRDSSDGFKRQYCGFRFRNAIIGQIDRRHITKLAETIPICKFR
jgi:hypothetical protein